MIKFCHLKNKNPVKMFYLNKFDVVLVLGAEETVSQGLDAEPLGQDEGTQPPELEKILKNFAPFSGLNKNLIAD